MHPKLENQLRTLLHFGLAYCFTFFLIIFFYFTSQFYASLYYLPVKILGTLAGYIMVGHVAPGGRFDFSLTYRGLNKEEKRFDELIQQYRNKYVVTIVILLFLISSIYVDLQTSIVAKITVFDSIVLFFFTLLLTVILGDGIKYLSAWWNIKKHWKKEFAS